VQGIRAWRETVMALTFSCAARDGVITPQTLSIQKSE